MGSGTISYCKTMELKHCVSCQWRATIDTPVERSTKENEIARSAETFIFKSSSNQYFRCTIETSTLTYVGDWFLCKAWLTGWLIERWIRYFSDSEPKHITQAQRKRLQKMWVVFYEVYYNQLEIYLAIYALNFNEKSIDRSNVFWTISWNRSCIDFDTEP